jgi:hypothetical protein
MKRSNGYKFLMESFQVADGAEISMIGGGVKIAKSNEKYRRLGKISIFLLDEDTTSRS